MRRIKDEKGLIEMLEYMRAQHNKYEYARETIILMLMSEHMRNALREYFFAEVAQFLLTEYTGKRSKRKNKKKGNVVYLPRKKTNG